MNLIDDLPLMPAAAAAVPSDSNEARQAALLLHTLGAADREWVVAQLPPSQRAQALRLLKELGDLGMPGDAALVDDLRGAASPSAAQGGDGLAEARAVDVAAVLRNEPDALVARLLRQADWPWRAELLDLLGPSRRRRLEELSASTRTAGGATGPLDMAVRESVASLVAAARGPRTARAAWWRWKGAR